MRWQGLNFMKATALFANKKPPRYRGGSFFYYEKERSEANVLSVKNM